MEAKEAEIQRLQAELKQAHDETDEILESTRDIEAQLEQDVSQLEKELHEAMRKNKHLTYDIEDWKERFKNTQVEHEKEITMVRTELANIIKTHSRVRDQLRDEELKHDDLERQERIISTSYQDLENKYHESLERNAMLESELSNRAALTVENQRLKDEVRDLTAELAVTQKRSTRDPIADVRHAKEESRDISSPLSDPDQATHIKHSYFVNSDGTADGHSPSERPTSRLLSSRNSTRSEHPVYTTIEAMRTKLRQARDYRTSIRPPSILSSQSSGITPPSQQKSPLHGARRTDKAHNSRPPVSLSTRPATSHALREDPSKGLSRLRRLSSGIPAPTSSRRVSNPSPARSQLAVSRPGSRAREDHLLRSPTREESSTISPSPNRLLKIPVFATPAKSSPRRQSGIPSLSSRKVL